MKKIIRITCMLMLFVILLSLAACGIENAETENENNATQTEQDTATADNAGASKNNDNTLGDYSVDILSCRLAKDFEDKDIVIIKYSFTNNDDDSASFSFAINDEVYQNGIGLNECYFVADNADYSSDNQTKDIKKGATLEVEVAYELNDTTTKIDVEISELISFSNKKITKSFEIV